MLTSHLWCSACSGHLPTTAPLAAASEPARPVPVAAKVVVGADGVRKVLPPRPLTPAEQIQHKIKLEQQQAKASKQKEKRGCWMWINAKTLEGALDPLWLAFSLCVSLAAVSAGIYTIVKSNTFDFTVNSWSDFAQVGMVTGLYRCMVMVDFCAYTYDGCAYCTLGVPCGIAACGVHRRYGTNPSDTTYTHHQLTPTRHCTSPCGCRSSPLAVLMCTCWSQSCGRCTTPSLPCCSSCTFSPRGGSCRACAQSCKSSVSYSQQVSWLRGVLHEVHWQVAGSAPRAQRLGFTSLAGS